MSDFLTQLAARSAAGAEVIRPRLASLFEPLQSGPGSVGGSAAAQERVAEPAVFDEASREAHSRLQQHMRRTVEPLSAQLEYRLDEDPSRAVESTNRRSPPYPPEVPRSAPANGLDPLPSPERLLPRAQSHDVSFFPAVPAADRRDHAPASFTTRLAPGTQSLLSPGPEQARRAASLERVAAFERRRGLEAKQSEQARPVPKPPTEAVLAPRLGVVHAADRARLAEARRNAQPEPVIQVTIGRIEVRATMPPASAPRKERLTPQPMSLGEYLRRRSKQGGE